MYNRLLSGMFLPSFVMLIGCSDKNDKPVTEVNEAPNSALDKKAVGDVEGETQPRPTDDNRLVKASAVRVPRAHDNMRGDAVHVEVVMPPGWKRDPDPRIAHWEPVGGDGKQWFKMSVQCFGSCESTHIAERIAERTAKSITELNESDSKVEFMTSEATKGGVIQSTRGHRRKQFRVTAYYHRPSDRFAIRMTGAVPFAEKHTYRDVFLAAARSLRVTGTSIEEGRKKAVSLPGDALVIEAIPKNIVLQHKKLDDVIMLSQDVVLAGVAISMGGVINTDRVTEGRRIHRYLLAADHEFTNPGGIEGTSVTCAEAEWVEDWGTYKFSCTLSKPFTHAGFSFMAFQVLRINEGVVSSGYLSEAAKIDGKSCEAGMWIRRDDKGKLVECGMD